MVAVKGESVWWTSSLRSFDTRPLRAFIMKSIISFIICISTTLCGGAIFATDGRLLSCRSCLLRALLPSSPSRFHLLVVYCGLVPSCSSPWLLGLVLLWCSCFSKSWFCLVRRSIATARVYIYLLRVVMRGSPSWLLLVAIQRVSTIQRFNCEMVIWLLSRSL